MSNPQNGGSPLRDFELVLGDPITYQPRRAPRLPAAAPKPSSLLRAIQFLQQLSTVGANASEIVFKRPFGSALLIAFLSASFYFGVNVLSQEKVHPSPLFGKPWTLSTQTDRRVEEKTIDDVIATLAIRQVSTPSRTVKLSAPAFDDPSLVSAVQKELARLGLYVGTIDGVIGQRTEHAIRTFEQRAGLKRNGKASPSLLALLRAEENPPAPKARIR